MIWMVVGGLLGWLASIIMRTDAQQDTLMNIVIGMVGAFIVGMFLSPFFGVSTINQNNFSGVAMLVSLLGVVILLAVLNFFRRGTVR